MSKKIFERDYSAGATDCNDIIFLGEFARKDALFRGEQEAVEFTRFATRQALFAEQFGAFLEVCQSENSIAFDISAQSLSFAEDHISF